MRATPDEATLAGAIARYHELCEDPELAGPAVVQGFVDAQRAAGLTFGGVVQCRSLRPAFITTQRLDALRAAVAILWDAFAMLERRAVSDTLLADYLRLSEPERQLIAIDPGYDDATVVSRLDTYFAAVPHVLEYNADSPAGMSYQAGQSALMRRLPVFERFAAEYGTATLRADIALRETLLAVWREFARRQGRGRAMPRVAILDLADAATSAEFQLVKRDFEMHGMATLVTTPEQLRFDGGALSADGEPIDLVYKRLLVADFLQRYDLSHPLVRAYAAGAVCVASSFRCTIAHKKLALAALADPRYAAALSDGQRRAVREFVPRTIALRADAAADSLPDRMTNVLKPNDAHGGEDVVLGWECPAAQWRERVAHSAHHGFVLQERVQPTYGRYPIFDAAAPAGGIRLRDMIEDCNAYVFRGALGGILTRLSESQIVNVSRGGQAIPTFVLEAA
ncbi:MAG: hypothetical protein M3Z37_08660 [Candidatus Eremiobacteraeota bacterium]|nr:hypothetical protein [Candidatus Eremiobacteraeota bacterium]